MLTAEQQLVVAGILRRFNVFARVMPDDIPLVHVQTGGTWGLSATMAATRQEASMPTYEVDVGHRAAVVKSDVAYAVKRALEDAGVPLATFADIRAFRDERVSKKA